MKDKREWAKLLYTRTGLSQKEIAQKVGASEKSIGTWKEADGWDAIRASLSISKDEELKRIYTQINELNNAISNKDQGSRYANSKEADTLSKLAAAAKALESEKRSVAETIDVFIGFHNWLRSVDLKQAQAFVTLQDDYIKTLLK